MSLKDFKILEKLGSGAYSVVHKVKRRDDGKIYALKKVIYFTTSTVETLLIAEEGA